MTACTTINRRDLVATATYIVSVQRCNTVWLYLVWLCAFAMPERDMGKKMVFLGHFRSHLKVTTISLEAMAEHRYISAVYNIATLQVVLCHSSDWSLAFQLRLQEIVE